MAVKTQNIKQAYNVWAEQYDTNINKTRDLEAQALQDVLGGRVFDNCLELGCGTGKNTFWLLTVAKNITAVDLSEGMLIKAKAKIKNAQVTFLQSDLTQGWLFADRSFDLVVFSLVLEHIENLADIFGKLAKTVVSGGCVYIGELHPFKQYNGTKARFETENGEQILDCFVHNISDFTTAARLHDFEIADLREYFDQDDKTIVPRIMALLLRKK
jgi:ubiquinone/menaquinone biosynthesis C-methylase UbiE